jgi:hypothetical protein
MVNAAIMILKHQCVWNMVPQWTSAPTTFSKTATYLDRAKAYVAAADQCVRRPPAKRASLIGRPGLSNRISSPGSSTPTAS